MVQIPDDVVNVDYLNNCPIKPRLRPFWEYSEAGVTWGIPISIWAKWICDETDKELKVFENDWEITKDKLLKAIKNNPDEEKKLKEVIKPHQKQIRWLQKHYASLTNINGVWVISEVILQSVFVNLPNFMCTDYGEEQAPIIFRETVSTDKSFGIMTPASGAVRYQFLNLMVKAAARRYKMNPKKDISYSDAMQLFLDDQVPHMEK